MMANQRGRSGSRAVNVANQSSDSQEPVHRLDSNSEGLPGVSNSATSRQRTNETRNGATLQAGQEGGSNSATPPSDSFVGYQIVKEIHRGGQGIVYQAVQKSTKRKVAIKVLKEGPFASKSDRARFEREVEVLGQLSHPNIVAVHDTGIAAGCFYFVMAYISGQPLDVWMASRQRSIDETLRLFQRICEPVNAAHLRGVIHRDLKPGNVRIDDAGEPHILDFGLAKVAHGVEEASLMTMTGQFMGSLPWASPEQAEAKPGKIDVRTDVYSLGVVLYQMLTAKFPYEVIGSMRDVLDRIMQAEPVRPSTIRKQINDEVETIILKCLAKERERRYQSAGELARDIGHYLRGEPIEAKRDSPLYVLKKQLRKYKGPVTIGAAFVMLLVLSTSLSTALYFHAVGAERAQARERQRADAERVRAETALAAEEEQRKLAEEAETTANEQRVRAEEYAGRLAIQLDERRTKDLLSDAGTFAGAQKPDRARRALLEALEIAQRHPNENCQLKDKVIERLAASYFDSKEWALAEAQYENLVAVRRSNLTADWQLSFWAYVPGTIIEEPGQWGKIVRSEPLARLETNELAFDWGVGAPAQAVPSDYFATVAETRMHVPPGRYDIACLADDGIRLSVNGTLVINEFRWHGGLVEVSVFVSTEDGDLSVRAEHFNSGGPAQLRVWVRPAEASVPAVPTAGRVLTASVAEALAHLTEVRHQLGKVREENAASEEAVAICLDDHKRNNTAWEQAARYVGDVLAGRGDYATAESLYRAALMYERNVLGDEHSDTVIRLDRLGNLLAAQGDRAAAERLFQETQDICQRRLDERRQSLGQVHRDTLAALQQLGKCYERQGRYSEAADVHAEAVSIRLRTLGEAHADTLLAMEWAAHMLTRAARWDEAAELYARVIEVRKRTIGEEHNVTVRAEESLAELNLTRGKPGDAERLCRAILATRRKTPGNDDLLTANALRRLAVSLSDQERWSEAEPLLREALDIQQNKLPADDWQVASTESRLGQVLGYLGSYEEGERLLLQACFAAKKDPDAPADLHRVILERIATLYENAGRPAQAEEWREKLVQWQASTQPASAPSSPSSQPSAP